MSPNCYNEIVEEQITIEYYESETDNCPYLEWEAELPNNIRTLVRKRLNRVRLGNFGDIDHIEGSIYELRFHIGPGFRIYLPEKAIVLSSCCVRAKKKSQKRDIAKAKKYWQEIN